MVNKFDLKGWSLHSTFVSTDMILYVEMGNFVFHLSFKLLACMDILVLPKELG